PVMFCAAADNATNRQMTNKKSELLRIVRLRHGYRWLDWGENNVFILDICCRPLSGTFACFVKRKIDFPIYLTIASPATVSGFDSKGGSVALKTTCHIFRPGRPLLEYHRKPPNTIALCYIAPGWSWSRKKLQNQKKVYMCR